MKQELFKIEKNVPLPEARGGGPGKYPFAAMKPGDSFVCSRSSLDRVRVAAANHGKHYNMKFTSRTINKRQARVWRIK